MKKLVSVVLALILALSLLSVVSAENEEITLNIMLPDFNSDKDWVTFEEGNPILQYIYEKTGVKLDITWVADSAYGEKTSLTLADKDNMPEVMVMQGVRDALMISSARAGAFWDVTEFVENAEEYPYLAAGAPATYDNIAIDGRLYGIYRARDFARAGAYYRTDYAEAAGITEKPETVEDFKELCFAIAEQGDAYVINMCKYVTGTIGVITVWCGAPYQYGVNEDGEIYPAFEDEKFQEGLDFLRDLYAAGGIDPNFMTIESGSWNDAERSDPAKAIMRLDCLDNGYRYQEWLETNMGADAENPVVGLISTLTNEDGEIMIWPQNIGASGEVCVSKAVSEDKLPAVMKFLDWCCGPDGQVVINCGLEGVNYWIHSDGSRYTYPEGEKDNMETYTNYNNTTLHSLNQLHMDVAGNFSPATAHTPLRDEYAEILLNNGQYVISNPCYTLDSQTNVLVGSTINTTVEDAQVQYIAGKIDLAGLQAAYADWHAQGGDQILAEYQAAYD